MFHYKEKYRTEGLILGLLLGILVAAIVSLLYAPKSGKELRKDISTGSKKAWDQADDYLDTARKKGHDVVEDVSETASSYFDVASNKASKAASKTKGMFKRKTDDPQEKIHDIAKDVGNRVEHVKN